MFDAPSQHVSTAKAAPFLPIWSCSVWGLPCPPHYWSGGALLPHLFTLTAASSFGLCPPEQKEGNGPAARIVYDVASRINRATGTHPYKACTTTPRRYVFCGTFRRMGLNPSSRTLSGTLLYGVRTFLFPRPKAQKATVRSSCLQLTL